jgi:hypothetical protein
MTRVNAWWFVPFLGLLLLVIVVLFLFGPLFPWSPVKLNYQTKSFQTYDVVYQTGTQLPPFYAELDSVITDIHTTLNLKLLKRIKLIRTDKQAFQGYLPWIQTESIGGAALQTGDVLYISYKKIQERKLSEEEFIRHELVHLINHQNSTLASAFRGGSVPYISEGIAFYMGGPKYYTDDEFLKRLRKASLTETTTGDQIYAADAFSTLDRTAADQYKISHMLYGRFIAYLITKYGQSTFNAFNKDFLSNPEKHREHFQKHFKQKLDVVLKDFEKEILQ